MRDVIKRRLLCAAGALAALAAGAFLVVGGSGAGAAPGGHGSGSGADTTAPQPPSNADYSGHGANVHGPYDSTRDGSPSRNGNGKGKAVGKPCAGCVGKADNKNPPGQLPGGSDANAGYECDRNHGVGRSNPAHTGCVPSSTTPRTPPSDTPSSDTPPSDTPSSDTPPSDTPPSDTPPSGSTASAPGSPGDTGSTPGAQPGSPQAGPHQAVPADVPPSPLAQTGAIDVPLYAGVAGLLVLLGLAALTVSGRISRRG